MLTAIRRSLACLLVASLALAATEKSSGQVREPLRPEIRGVIKTVDLGVGKITVAVGEGREAAATEKTFALAKDVEVVIGSGRGGFLKEGKPADLAVDLRVALSLSADQKSVECVTLERPMVRGQIKAVDGTKNTITITLPPGREEPGEDRTYTLAADAEVAVDDGRGSRFSVKEAALTDLAQGSQVSAVLSIDQKQIHFLVAEGPILTGVIKAIDPAKRTLTLVRPARERGDGAMEETTHNISQKAVVLLDDGKGRRPLHKEVKLTDLPTGTSATVRLSVDQAWVMSIRAEGATQFGVLKAVDANKGIIIIAVPRGRDNPEEKTLTLAKDARIVIDGVEVKLASLKVESDGPVVRLRLSLDQKTVQIVMTQRGDRR